MSEPHDPTEMAGAADAHTESAYAWGASDDSEELAEYVAPKRGLMPGVITAAVVVASVAIVGAAGAVAYKHLHEETHDIASSTESTTSSLPSTTHLAGHAGEDSGITAPPTTPTVTVQAPPVTVQAVPLPAQTPTLSDYDRRFLAAMEKSGWIVTDPVQMAWGAHQVCSLFHQGFSPEYVNGRVASESGLGMSYALQFTSNALLSYPDCF